MISTKGRYALRLMVDIATYSNGEVISLKDISKREEISIKYLEQVVSLLTRGGMLVSIRGNSGGYLLAKDPKDYRVGDILRVAEGSLAPIACLQCSPNNCPRASTCSTIEFWEGYYKAITDYVDNITLEDLKNRELERLGNDYNI